VKSKLIPRFIIAIFISSTILLSYQNCSDQSQLSNHPIKGKSKSSSLSSLSVSSSSTIGVSKYDLDGGLDNKATSIGIQSDQKILVAGRVKSEGTYRLAVIRKNTNGILDSTFNGTGVNILKNLELDSKLDKPILTVTKQDSIYISGSFINSDSSKKDIFVVKLTSDGQLDETFGTLGIAIFDINNESDDLLTGVASPTVENKSDEKILLFGTTGNKPDRDLFLLKLDSKGTTDMSFGSNGKLVIDASGNHSDDLGGGVKVQWDNKIIICGTSFDPSKDNSDFLVMRLNVDGSLDSSFNSGGKNLVDFDNGSIDFASDLILETATPNKMNTVFNTTVPFNIYVIGSTQKQNSNSDFAIFKLTSNGSLDQSFNTTGKLATDFNLGSEDYAAAALIQQDHKIIIMGSASKSDQFSQVAVARYLTSGTLDTSFNLTGKMTLSTLDKTPEYGSGLVQNTFVDKNNNLFMTTYTDSDNIETNSPRFTTFQLDLTGHLVK
jgi:uncharacterized delta-60 repeat protein